MAARVRAGAGGGLYRSRSAIIVFRKRRCVPRPSFTTPSWNDRDEPDVTPKTTERFVIDGPAGTLEVALNAPAGAPRGIALVAHPHPQQGGTLDNKVAQTLAKTFFALGYASVRFNFRGVGQSRGTFDDGVGETDGRACGARAREAAVMARFRSCSPVFRSARSCRRASRATVTAERMVLVGPAAARFGDTPVPADTIVIHGEEDDVVPLPRSLPGHGRRSFRSSCFPDAGIFSTAGCRNCSARSPACGTIARRRPDA